MIDLLVETTFQGLDKFTQNVKNNLVIAVQDAAVEVELIGIEEVLLLDAYDTYALMESIYVSLYGYSTYDEKTDMAADAALNNPTNWEAIRAWKLGQPGGIPPHANSRDSGMGSGEAPETYIEFDPQVTSESPYDAWVAVAASHGKYVENGYISWFGNWVPARPFWEATAQRAIPVVLAILQRAVDDAMTG